MIRVEIPSDFAAYGAVSLPQATDKVLLYGAGPQNQPGLGTYDLQAGKWATTRLTELPATVMRAYATVLENGNVGVLVGIRESPNGAYYVEWATFDGTTWQIEDKPTRWLLRSPLGLATSGGRTYALVWSTYPNLELWRLEDSGWTQDVSPPGITSGWLVGNGTSLTVCGMNQDSTVVLLSRTATELTYRQSVVASNTPGFGTISCAIDSPTDRPPILAWFAPLVVLGSPANLDIQAATFENGAWRLQRVGRDAEPKALISTDLGAFFLSEQDMDPLWRLAEGKWEPCPETVLTPTPGPYPIRKSTSLIKWNSTAALVNRFASDSTSEAGYITLQPLDSSHPGCVPSGG
jgi:hypothetical protein